MTKILCLVLFTLCSYCWAISEEKLANDYDAVVLPFFNNGIWGNFVGSEGVKIRYGQFINPEAIASIVIVNGQGEFAEKYAETIYDLFQLKYSVFIFDHRGQGYSERMTDIHDLCHVDKFSHYVSDLNIFIEKYVRPYESNKLFMLAHSMGGAIAAQYLQKYPQVFDAVVLSSPMIGVNTSPYSEKVAMMIAQTGVKLGMGKRFAIGQKGYQKPKSVLESKVTRSQIRFTLAHQWPDIFPELAIGGVSYQWVQQSLLAARTLKRETIAYQKPILLLEAGKEVLVDVKDEEEYCGRAPYCHRVLFPTSFHEILNERDQIRTNAFEKINSFYHSNL